MDNRYEKLINLAEEARKYSYSPYSNFSVGAALLSRSGEIYTGANVENAMLGATNCAERTAFFTAVSAGERDFEAIAVVGGNSGEPLEDFCPPCGTCRQVMAEFCDENFKVILVGKSKEIKILTLSELLPFSFGKDNLK